MRKPETDSAIGALLRRNVDQTIAECGISTTELRRRAGFSRTQYSALFKSEHGPRLTTLIRLADALRIPVSELLKEG
jgi:transcriptional regulator with XRE-family HTH domain